MKRNRIVKIVMVGDISVNDEAREVVERCGSKSLFRYFRDFVGDADVVFGNLESPLSSQGKPLPRKILLASSEETVRGLKWAGFNVLNLANNHQFDFGCEGYKRTVELLEENRIRYVGSGCREEDASRSLILDVKGIRIGFLAYVDAKTGCLLAEGSRPGCNRLSLSKIQEDVVEVKKRDADYVVVSLHWGFEDYHYPSIQQREIARGVVDRGADVIVGHHPHVIQGMEWYRGRPIFYSLGDFVFADARRYDGVVLERTADNLESIAAVVIFSQEKMEGMDVTPFRMDLEYRPVPLKGFEKEEVVKKFRLWSDQLGHRGYGSFWKRLRLREEIIRPIERMLRGKFVFAKDVRVRRSQMKELVNLFVRGPMRFLLICLGRDPVKR